MRSSRTTGVGQRDIHLSILLAALLTVSMTSCTVWSSTPPSASVTTMSSIPPDDQPPSNDAFVIVAAGDIARSREDGQGTAVLIQSLHPDAVLTLGDNAYESGSATEYRQNYNPTWGAFKDITKPIPGNHDYRTDNAAGYFGYFRD